VSSPVAALKPRVSGPADPTDSGGCCPAADVLILQCQCESFLQWLDFMAGRFASMIFRLFPIGFRRCFGNDFHPWMEIGSGRRRLLRVYHKIDLEMSFYVDSPDQIRFSHETRSEENCDLQDSQWERFTDDSITLVCHNHVRLLTLVPGDGEDQPENRSN
jgi:hypothetical protein